MLFMEFNLLKANIVDYKSPNVFSNESQWHKLNTEQKQRYLIFNMTLDIIYGYCV